MISALRGLGPNHQEAPVTSIPRPVPTVCEHRGCANEPDLGKPFCSAHVGALPYARAVELEHEARERELSLAMQGRVEAVDPYGSRSRDLVAHLRREGKAVCFANLVEPLDVDQRGGIAAVKAYVSALERAGIVRVWRDEGKDRDGIATWVEVIA